MAVSLTYNGSATAPTAPGSYAVVGTINDSNYEGTAIGTLVIGQGAATITLGNLSATYSGMPKAVTAITNPAGLAVNLTYNGSGTAPTAAGSYTVVGTINDANYQGTATGTLNIARATPTITWANPADITYGTALGTAQLNATASVPGTFSYTPAAGTILSAGTGQTLTATFTPTDSADCNGATQTVAINATKATATITLGNLTATYDDTPKAATATTIPPGLAVTITYNGSTTAPVNTGNYNIVGTINDTNYQGSTNGTFTICGKPVLIVSTLPDGSYTNNEVLNITGTVTDFAGIKYLTVNNVMIPFNSDGSFSQALVLNDGPNTVTVEAVDTLNYTTTNTRTITLDMTAPNLTITAPADNSTTATAMATVSGTVDETSTVAVTLGGNTVNATMNGTNFTAYVTLVPGTNTIEATATDLAGNISNTLKRTIVYDNQSPDLAITTPPQDISTNQANLTIIGTASDPYSDVTVNITMNGQTYTPAVVNGQFQQVVNFTIQKSYAIIVTATNEAGVSTTVQRNVIYQIAPPTVSLTFNPNGAYTVVGPTDGLTITVPDGHDTGTMPSYNVTLPALATNVVVTCYGGGGSPVSGDSPGAEGFAGDMVQSSTLTGILGVQLDLFVGQGDTDDNHAWPDGQYINSFAGASSSIYLHSGTVLDILAGGGDDAYGGKGGTRGPYNTNSLGDFGGTVTVGAGGAGGYIQQGSPSFVPAGNGWITITYLLQSGQ